ncbi:MAG: transglycosylase SLT domain-containing protein, partial [Gemmatimonadaceae bacterium]|nr:transglycosylase SLT domain-containing protein [Gemmatimonadaceae bacterium]
AQDTTYTASAAVLDSIPDSDTTKVAQHDVTGEAAKMFGDSAGGASSATDTLPTWDIDVHSYETHKRVLYFIDRFEHGAREPFIHSLERSGRYERMIREKLRAAGLPEDLAYLPIVESWYDPDAYSRAAAVGLWQLMTSTARGTGLRVDWWVDERRDPIRSTDAAIKFLGWLHDQFGSLYLACAAYDGGPGRIVRGLSRYADELDGVEGDDAFFALAEKDYLRAETRDYVPKLIAAALVAKDPKRYGFDITYDSEYVYDSVRVKPATPLAAVAAAVGVSTEQIVALNPHILRGMTPPHESYFVRVPVGSAATFDSAFAALPKEDLVAFKRVRVKKGETPARFAHRVGVPVTSLAWYNPHLKPTSHARLPVGEVMIVPTRSVLAAARNVPDPSIERYGSSRTTHVVRRGESLGLIARRYHTTVQSLMRLNRLRKSVIYPGQVIIVRGTPKPAPRHHTKVHKATG